MYYVSFEKATKNLPVLAVFCINVYIPCFFEIKKNSKFTDEAKIVKFPHKAAKEIYFKVKKRNGYFANPENILIGNRNVRSRRDCSYRYLAVNKY